MSTSALPKFYEEGIPDLLQDMRWVTAYPIEPNPCPKDEVCYRGLREMFHSQYLKFRDRLESMETEFLKWKTAKLEAEAASRTIAPSEWDGKGPCPVCKHEAAEDLEKWKLEELIEGLMEKPNG